MRSKKMSYHSKSFVAVDPAKRSGWAIFLNGEYLDSGYVYVNTIKGARAIEELMSKAKIYGIRLMVVEDSYPGGWVDNNGNYHKASYHTGKAIGICRGAWEQEARKRGFKIYAIKPSRWQRVLKIQGKRMKRAELKQMSVMVAKGVANKEIVFNDEADAICIGLFYIKYLTNQWQNIIPFNREHEIQSGNI